MHRENVGQSASRAPLLRGSLQPFAKFDCIKLDGRQFFDIIFVLEETAIQPCPLPHHWPVV